MYVFGTLQSTLQPMKNFWKVIPVECRNYGSQTAIVSSHKQSCDHNQMVCFSEG